MKTVMEEKKNNALKKGINGYCLKKFVKIVGSERGE